MTFIQEWQKVIGVTPDGVFGAETLKASLRFAGKPVEVKPAAAMIYQGSARYPVREIVVHCTATPPSWMGNGTFAERFAEIRRWHMQDRGWADIGYHHVIDRDGATMPGRAETVIGAGVEGHNSGVIHISLIGGGGSAATDAFSRNFTAAQDATLRRLIKEISTRTAIARVSGHNEWAAKACPGFFVPDWLTA
ncbi:MAG: hypothetical protein EBT13_14305 [Rhodobacteraceae bacterium]|nr:hypothetical protein [Paracoccaceae bacterium]